MHTRWIQGNFGEIRVNSGGNLIFNNTVSDGSGIYLSYSSNNTLRRNIMINNSYNLNIGGNSLTDYINDIDTSNTIDGRLIYYLVNTNNQIIDSTSNAGYVGVINSSGITIRDLTLRNNSQGVLFYHTNDSRIENVHIYNIMSGIVLHNSYSNYVTNNSLNSTQRGIALENSYGNYVANNSLNSTTEFGIYVLSSANNTLRDNKVKSNYLGLIVIGETKESYNNSIGSSNTLNGKPIYYFYDLHDTTIQGLDTSHLTVASSNNVTIKNNNIKNGDIVFLPFLSNSTIMNNTVQDNLYGIYLLFLSNNNTVYHNNLINNTINAIDAAISNQWDNGSEGNYWSDYAGIDEDHDGIGDTPYNISGNHVAQDRYPFMKVSGWLGDITPPASIKNPHASSFGTTWINWTWTNPSDVDFNHMMLYLDGSFVDNFSITYYNATNLLPSSIHTISTHTVDTSGNINQTWINDTALTAGDLSNGLNINVYKPENFSVYPVGETLRFDIEVTDSAGNPVDSGTSAYADLSGPNDASRQIILTKNGTNFTGRLFCSKR